MSREVRPNSNEIQKLSAEFFKRKFVHQITVFSCWNRYGKINYFLSSRFDQLNSLTENSFHSIIYVYTYLHLSFNNKHRTDFLLVSQSK